MDTKSMAQVKAMAVNVAILLLLTGCATKKMELTKSGFLSSYSGLNMEEESEGMYVYRNPIINIKERYSKIMLAPVKFKLDPTVKEHDQVDWEDKMELADYFSEKLVDGLIGNYDIVYEPGYDVLLLRTAITDILPNKVYLNLHWSTKLYGAGIGGASLEAELVDSLSGERVLSFIDARKGKKLNYTKGLTKWGHTEEVLGIWAKMIVMNLDELRDNHINRKAEAWTGEERAN